MKKDSLADVPGRNALPAALQMKLAFNAYGQAIIAMKAVLDSAGDKPFAAGSRLSQTVHTCLDLLQGRNHFLMPLTARSTAGNYLLAHSVNVSIFSMNLGIGMGWGKEDLHVLGFSALLHDLGMMKHLGLIQEPRKLTPAEHAEVRIHPVESLRLIEYIHDIEETVKRQITEIIGKEVERRDGKGGPKGLSLKDKIRAASQMIGLCDIYEAMSHHRAWREPLLPHEAVKRLIRNHTEEFDRTVIQTFVQRVSLYPPGSYILLASGEIARVIETHPQTPTLPTIEIRFAPDRSPVHPPKELDLSEHPLTHIQKALDETRLDLDEKSLLALQADRWWPET